MSHFVMAFTPYFLKNAMREINKIDDKAISVEKFSDGILLIQSKLNKDEFLNKLMKQNPIFIKHICPGDNIGKIKGTLEEDKELILNLLLSNDFSVNPGEKFSIQTRIINGGSEGNLPYSSRDIEVYIGTYFSNLGGIPVFSNKALINEKDVKVFSIVINKVNIYIGNSTSNQNLNFSCDEYRIVSKSGKKEISRAENKLKEALSKFNITFGNDTGMALDIGAAPGGWTKVLVDYGFSVVSVDPGDLHPVLQNHPNVKHHKCRIEDLTFENYFDIIVNDMNIDSQLTSKIMNSLSGSLKDDGLAIVTFKIPNKPEKSISESIKIISKHYEVLKINCLFHNRQEVTVLLKKVVK